MSLNDIVNVTVTSGTRQVPMPAFSIAGILSDECNFPERVRYYSSLTELESDLCIGSNSITYKAANALLAPAEAPNTFAVLNRLGTKTILGNAGTFTAGTISLKVNNVAITSGTYNSSKATTMAQLATNIQSALTGIVTTAYVSASDTLTITPAGTTLVYVTDIDTSLVTGTLTLSLTSPTIIKDSAGTFTAGTIYATVNGTLVSATGTVKDTIMTALAAVIGPSTAGGTAVLTGISSAIYSNSSHTITVIPQAGYPAIITVDYSGITGTMTAGVITQGTESTAATTLNAAMNYDNGWYAIVSALGTTTDPVAIALQLAISAWTESNKKIAIHRTTDLVTINTASGSDTTSLAHLTSAASYARTTVIYGGQADTEFPDAVLLGTILTKAPGSYTCMFKTLVGVTADALTTTQVTNAHNKKASVYINEALDILDNGATASGEWLDIIIGLDWLVSLIQTNVMTVFVNNNKLPYDERGLAAVSGAIAQAMESGISSSLLTKMQKTVSGVVTGGYIISMPAISSISSTDKANRVLNNVSVTGFLAGAIHATTINVVVLY